MFCATCGEEKSRLEFSDERFSECRSCEDARVDLMSSEGRFRPGPGLAERRSENRRLFQELKDGLRCERCGESANPCLDFHHIDPATKEYNVGVTAQFNIGVAIAEMAKCIVLCANCHRKLHAGLIEYVGEGVSPA